jgi:hypothetical protein
MTRNRNEIDQMIRNVENDVLSWYDDLKASDTTLYNKVKSSFDLWRTSTNSLLSAIANTNPSSSTSPSKDKGSGTHSS